MAEEAKYQSKIIKRLESFGYYVLKLISTNKNGIPDILALRADRAPLLIEVKARKGKPSELQKYRIEELRGRSFDAFISYNGDGLLKNTTEEELHGYIEDVVNNNDNKKQKELNF